MTPTLQYLSSLAGIFDPKDYISIDSPMAPALMKKEVGDEAVVKTEAGEFVWHVTKIEYLK